MEEVSKVLLTDFHYNYVMNIYGDKFEMYTESCLYKVEAENVYENFYKDRELFDLSNDPEAIKYFYNANNLVAGKMKDETNDMPVKNVLDLKSKPYNFIAEDNQESKIAKSINKNVVND